MKQFLLLTAISANCIGAFAQTRKNIPVLKLEEETYVFDTLEYGDECSHDFIFTNTGNETLILSNVTTACGCDVPSYDKKPVKPGAKSFVNYKYDSKRPGPFSKTMTLTGNFEGESKIIVIKGYVKPRSEQRSPVELKSDLSLVTYQQEKENEVKKQEPKKKKQTKKRKYEKRVTRNKMD